MRNSEINSAALACAIFAAVMVTGCQSPRTLTQSAAPNPLRNQKEFALRPVEMTGLMVDDQTEENFKASKKSVQIRNWDGDKVAINGLFEKSLTAGASRAGISISPQSTSPRFTVQPAVILIDNGYYKMPVWNAISRIKMKITILDPDGKIVDELVVQDSEPFDAIVAPSSGGRLRSIAETLGLKCAKYLKKRTAG